jgi:NitT/TauT family transport system substrate-binding protein
MLLLPISLSQLARAALVALAFLPYAAVGAPLKIAYSDWPGWVAWEIALQKGWLKEAGLNDVEFVWSEYAPSIEAFSAGKVDGIMIANGDALVSNANGARNVMVLLTDYSNGNDMIIAGPKVKSISDLKGKKVGLETGSVEHLLLIHALKRAGLTEADVTIVNTLTSATPALFASGKVDAVGAWQPVAGQALKAVVGAHRIYTTADETGLIYDGLAVTPRSLADRRDDWLKVISVWDQIVSYLRSPATKRDAIAIMAARSGVSAVDYALFIEGTCFLSLQEGAKKMNAKANAGFGSLKFSGLVANDFNLKTGVYNVSQDASAASDPALVEEILATAASK